MTDKQYVNNGVANPPTEENLAEPKRGVNGRFLKGSPPPRGVGRKKGIPNRFSASIKGTFENVFADLQKDKKLNLHAWATANPSDFYRLANRLVEKSIDLKAEVRHGVDPETLDVFSIARRIAFVLAEAARLEQKNAPTPEPKMLTASEVEVNPRKAEVNGLDGEPVRRVAPDVSEPTIVEPGADVSPTPDESHSQPVDPDAYRSLALATENSEIAARPASPSRINVFRFRR